MTKSKNMKSALISSILALLLCFSMLLGTTFAWFTDSVTSSGNIIKAGNLDVSMDWAEGTADPQNTEWTDASLGAIFKNDLWEPGYIEVRHIKIENKGSLALKYQISIAANGDVSELADVIDVYYIDPAQQIENRDNLSQMIPMGTLSAMLDNMSGDSSTATGNLLAGEAHTVTIALKMQETAGNKYQGLSIGTDFSIKLSATQYNYENDSFGSDYDEGLDPEATYVSGAQSLKDAMLIRDAYIVLNEDIIVDASTPLQWGAYMFVANGREVTIDLNGNDIIVEDDALLKTHAVFTTANGGTLNIVGDGTVTVKNGKSGIFHAMNANDQINVYGGTYVSNSDNGSDSLAILYTNSGNIDVYGGMFHPLDGVECANAEDKQGNRLSIVFHEGAILKHTKYYAGNDATRIQLAEGCYLKKVQIDGEEWWQVTKAEDAKVINSFADMIDVCKNGGKMVLAKDITYTAENTEIMIDGSIFLINGKNVTVDLNGHNITVDENATQVFGAVFFVGNPGGHIDIVGDGEITVKNGKAPIVWVLQSGTANIYGGTFTSNSVSTEAMFYSQGNGGVINVYGGKYTYDLDRHLNGGFNVSDQAGNALRIILHEGVLLSRPEYSQHLQGTTNGEQNRIQLAEGCTLEEVVLDGETWYQVVKK